MKTCETLHYFSCLVYNIYSAFCSFMMPKYGVDKENLPLALPTRYGSALWKAVGNVWSEVLQGTG